MKCTFFKKALSLLLVLILLVGSLPVLGEGIPTSAPVLPDITAEDTSAFDSGDVPTVTGTIYYDCHDEDGVLFGGSKQCIYWNFRLDNNKLNPDYPQHYIPLKTIDVSDDHFELGATFWTTAKHDFPLNPMIECEIVLPNGMTIEGQERTQYGSNDNVLSDGGDGRDYRCAWNVQMQPNLPNGTYTVMVNVSSRQFHRDVRDGPEVWIQDDFCVPVTVNYTGGTDQPLMESLKVSDNDSFLDCTASLPENVRLDHVNNTDGLVSWNFCMEPGAASGVYVVPIDFLFHHPQGPDSDDYQGTLNLNIHYMDTATDPSNGSVKTSETLSLFNGTFHLYTTDQNPVAGCTLNLPEGFSITPGSTSVVGPGRYGWTAKILPSMASGDYSVPISAHWKSRDLSDTGHFEFSIPINYTAPVVPSGEIVYQITEAGKDYYLVGFNRDKLSPMADSASLQAVAAMSETDILAEDIALESLGVKASTTTSSSVSFALVTTAGSNSGKVFQYTEGASTPWKDAKTTLTIPTAAKGAIASAAATPPSAYVFPTDYTIKKLNLDAFREQILEKVIIALGNTGVEIPEDELINIKAGIFYGVDRYGFGDLIIKSNAVDMKVNESSVYYLYARHMTGLAICAWMSSINYKGMDNAFNQLKTVGFLPKCGYMTPEATLGLKNGREYTAVEFNQIGEFGQGLELDYLGVKQLATNLVKLQSDYSKLKKMNNNWVMKPQSGTWNKVIMPKDPTMVIDPALPLVTPVIYYIREADENGDTIAIACENGAAVGRLMHYVDGQWVETQTGMFFSAIPSESVAPAYAISATARSSSAFTAGATSIINTFDYQKYFTFVTKIIKTRCGIDYSKLTKKQQKDYSLAVFKSIDDNMNLGAAFFTLKLVGKEYEPTDEYVYWVTKNTTDCIFLTMALVALKTEIDIIKKDLQLVIPSFVAVFETGPLGLAALGSEGIVATGVSATTIGTAVRVGVSTYHCSKSSGPMAEAVAEHLKELNDAFYAKLNNTDKFQSIDDVKHMLEGEVDVNGVAKGFHYEGQGANSVPGSKGEIIGKPTKPADTSLPAWSQIYEARVKIDGVEKIGKSTFFPKAMTPQVIITEVNRALKNGKLIEPGIVEGVSKYGFKIKIYLNGAGKVTNAHPIMP